MKYSIFYLPLLLMQYSFAQKSNMPTNADGNTLLWEISGKGLSKASYLYGTFHMMCKDEILLSDNLRKCIEKSKEVYFEMDLDDPATTLGAFMMVNMKDGKTLKDLYSPEEYQRVENYFKDSIHTGLMMLQRMKPSFIQALLYPKMMPCKQMSGVEEEIMAIAKKSKKPINGFETMAFQSSVFDSIPYEQQAKELLNMVDSIPMYASYFDTMLHVYKTQQLKQLEEMFADPKFNMDDQNKEVLLDKRNRDWVNQLKTIMPDKNVFVAVGAGHLVGDRGLLELLKKEGYSVRPIVNK